MTPAVSLARLRKTFDGHVVFDDVSLDVARGETVAILGASGCGKSTLLRIIAGLDAADSGTVAVAGEVGVVFQEPRLMPWLDVARNVGFAARDDVERVRVAETLALVGLERVAHAWPKTLSGGMAQRAALARSLVREPDVLLLDEPLSALDALLRTDLQTAIARIVRRVGCATVLVTHDVDEALYLADRVVVLAGTPARPVLTCDVPPERRRTRGTLPAERARLLAALGVEARDGPGASRSAADRIRISVDTAQQR